MARLVDPIVADYQKEFDEADAGARRGARAVLRLRWLSALLRALWLHALLHPADATERETWRRIASGLAIGTGLVVLLVTGPRAGLVWRVSEGSGNTWLALELLADLLPSALAVAIPCGVLLGALAVHGRGALTDGFGRMRPLVLASVVGSVLTFGLIAWIVPDANQAFRVVTHQAISMGDRATQPARGAREMTLAELQTRAWRSTFSGVPEAAARYKVEWHKKFAIPMACLVFGLTGAAFGRFRLAQSLRGRLLLSVAVVFGYYALQSLGERQAIQLSLAPAVGVWLANAACTAAAAATLLRRITPVARAGR